MVDKRKPRLEKIGCFFEQGNGDSGFHFFEVVRVSDGDVFVYNQGILWRLPVREKVLSAAEGIIERNEGALRRMAEKKEGKK